MFSTINFKLITNYKILPPSNIFIFENWNVWFLKNVLGKVRLKLFIINKICVVSFVNLQLLNVMQ